MTTLFGPERRTSAFTRLLRTLEVLLFLTGMVSLGVYGYSVAESWLYQRYETYVLDTELSGRKPSWRGFARQLAGLDLPASKTDRRAYEDLARTGTPRSGRREPPPDGLIGKIEMPRINVSATLREGVDAATLRRSAGHVPGTALPGDLGNAAIAAHRDGLFRGLKDVREDDVVRVTTRDGGTYEYRVHSIEIVAPEDVHVLEPRRERELTLITCYPFYYVGKAPKRYIVRAVQAGPVEKAAATRSKARKVQAFKLRR